jgi:hypothetical protein
MNTFRRIEIMAFCHRVTIVSGKPTVDTQANEGVCINNADSQEMITPESAEGQKILVETVRLLEEKIYKQACRTIFK